MTRRTDPTSRVDGSAINSRRAAAIAALVLAAAGLAVVVFAATQAFPRGLIAAALLILAIITAWEALRRRGAARIALIVVGILLLIAFGAVLVLGRVLVEAIVAVALFAVTATFAREAFRIRVPLPTAVAPTHPVVVWNPKSGGGKALSANLDVEARARGIEPIELRPGDDLVQLVREAVANGADALAAAGGDGTQALVATIAAELDLPFACIPAGTRNHFALDLGVDRDDVVGALDAFVDGGERRVDLAEVNGRVFVNNVSLGLYAEAVQRSGYRDAKIRTVLDTIPDFSSAEPGDHVLEYSGPGGVHGRRATVILVSNNSYRLGSFVGSGTRPSIDDGELGIAVVELTSKDARGRSRFRQWTATTFEVGSDGPVPAGVDGEALILEPPLRFSIRPGALRVRIAPNHPGASPSAAAPDGMLDGVRKLFHIARSG
jgi:diacylglycerol kinase family enzyme